MNKNFKSVTFSCCNVVPDSVRVIGASLIGASLSEPQQGTHSCCAVCIIGRAGASPPSLMTWTRCLYIYYWGEPERAPPGDSQRLRCLSHNIYIVSPLPLDQKRRHALYIYKIRTSRQFIQVQNLKVITMQMPQQESQLTTTLIY